MRRPGKRRPTVVAVDNEVAPARMEWNVERRIGFARDRDGEVGGLLQTMQIDAKMLQPIGETGLQDQVRPLAHRGGGQERQRGLGVGMHGQ